MNFNLIIKIRERGGKILSSNTNNSLEMTLNNLKNTIENLPIKNQRLIEQWIKSWDYYLKREKSFKPSQNIKYNPGDIITVCLGYNVGSEQGGNRPAVVIEDNDHSDKTVMIVPLSSLKKHETEKDVHKKNVYLGVLKEYNLITGQPKDTKNKALVNQMRAISKQRIIKPVKAGDTVIRLDSENLRKIYDKIIELYASKFSKELQQTSFKN